MRLSYLIAAAVLVPSACATVAKPSNDPLRQPLIEDVSCVEPGAKGSLTNRSDVTHSFAVHVEFRDGSDEPYATAVTAVDNLPPGQSVEWTVSAASSGALRGSCEVVKVDTLPII